MSIKIEKHATKVVERFKEMLTDEQVEMIGNEHFGELEMLIEAAIGSTEAEALLEAVAQVETLAKSIAKHASKIENLDSF